MTTSWQQLSVSKTDHKSFSISMSEMMQLAEHSLAYFNVREHVFVTVGQIMNDSQAIILTAVRSDDFHFLENNQGRSRGHC